MECEVLNEKKKSRGGGCSAAAGGIVAAGSCEGSSCVNDVTTAKADCQPCSCGKFAKKKQKNLVLVDCLRRLGRDSEAERCADCGSILEFAVPLGDEHAPPILYNANFCRHRLCPLCGWRRSLKVCGQLSRCLDYLGNDYKYLFLTLTVRNVPASELGATLGRLTAAYTRFLRFRELGFIRGAFRSIEITRNIVTGEYHPHIHAIVAVPKSYGDKVYLRRDDWLRLWRVAYGDETITQVDIRRCRPKADPSADELAAAASVGALDDALRSGSDKSIIAAVLEVAKYTVKDSDYLIEHSPALTDRIVKELLPALYHRRFVSFSGCFREAWQILNLQDPNAENLELSDRHKLNPCLAYFVARYRFCAGCGYVLGDDSYIIAATADPSAPPDERKKQLPPRENAKFVPSIVPKRIANGGELYIFDDVLPLDELPAGWADDAAAPPASASGCAGAPSGAG